MDTPQNEYCALCNTYPEDILMLTCNHDLCLMCAAKLLQKEEMKQSGIVDCIICDICHSETLLEESSIYELRKLYQKKKQHQHKQIEQMVKNTTINGLQSLNIQSDKVSVAPHTKISRGNCVDHPDEEIYYYCFDCMCNCICPECVIHGSHKNHDVITIKKAYPIIKEKVDDLVYQINSKLNNFKVFEEKLNTKKKDFYEHAKNQKKQILEAFNEIRTKIDKKERDILSQLENILNESDENIDEFIGELNNKMDKMMGIMDQINDHVQAKQDTTLLNFYSCNVNKILNQIQNDELNTKSFQIKPFSPTNQSDIFEQLCIVEQQINELSLYEKSRTTNSTNASINNNNISNTLQINNNILNSVNIKNQNTLTQPDYNKYKLKDNNTHKNHNHHHKNITSTSPKHKNFTFTEGSSGNLNKNQENFSEVFSKENSFKMN